MAKIKYVKTTSAGKAPTYKAPSAYSSKYQGNIYAAMDKVTNFKYDPMEDASYRALAKVYNERGNKAAKDTMGDAAALNGGYGTSYATSAAQQARNDYNMQLASYIPDLEQNAYNRNVQALSAYRDADDTAYGRYRDNVSDKQWQHSQNYQAWSDNNANYWNQMNYNLDVYAAKKSSSSGGGSSRGGRSSRGYGAGRNYYGNDGIDTGYSDALAKVKDKDKNKTTGKTSGGKGSGGKGSSGSGGGKKIPDLNYGHWFF